MLALANYLPPPYDSIMILCLSCRQPLPSGRIDKQTCSPRCRTQLYRQRRSAQLPPRGSGRLRQGLLLQKPIWFRNGSPPDPALYDYDDSKIAWASEVEWDQTLVLLNQLHTLLDELDFMGNWPGEMGYNGDEPPNGIDTHPICAILVQKMGEIRQLQGQLQATRGAVYRIWSSYEPSFVGQLKPILHAMRVFVLDHHELEEPFEIQFTPALQQAITSLHRDVLLWWFDLLEQTP